MCVYIYIYVYTYIHKYCFLPTSQLSWSPSDAFRAHEIYVNAWKTSRNRKHHWTTVDGRNPAPVGNYWYYKTLQIMGLYRDKPSTNWCRISSIQSTILVVHFQHFLGWWMLDAILQTSIFLLQLWQGHIGRIERHVHVVFAPSTWEHFTFWKTQRSGPQDWNQPDYMLINVWIAREKKGIYPSSKKAGRSILCCFQGPCFSVPFWATRIDRKRSSRRWSHSVKIAKLFAKSLKSKRQQVFDFSAFRFFFFFFLLFDLLFFFFTFHSFVFLSFSTFRASTNKLFFDFSAFFLTFRVKTVSKFLLCELFDGQKVKVFDLLTSFCFTCRSTVQFVSHWCNRYDK